jgi:serine/threonine protein kinase
MEYVEGERVDEYASRMSLRDKLSLMKQICDAVSYAHRNLIIHRDLKPSNIMVDSAGRPKLLDFGIAKILDDATDRTLTVQRMLTPEFSSPEQFTDRPPTTATDVYSLGAVLYKLLTGRSPHEFPDSTPERLLSDIQTREPVRPSKLVPELGGDLDDPR